MIATADSPLTIVTGDFNAIGIVANDIVYEGAMVGDNALGYGRPLVAGDVFLGHSLVQVDNSVKAGQTGLAGAKIIRLRTGRYRGAVTLTGVLITDVLKEVYASDDATLTLTAAGNTRVGVVIRYESTNKAIVEFQTNEPFAEAADPYEKTFGDLLVGGSYQGLYGVSDTQNYPIGTKRELPGSDEVAYYSKSSGECWSGRGAMFVLAMSAGIDFTLLGATSAVAAEQVTFAAGADPGHPAFDENELKGGLLLISDQDSGETQDKMVQNRIITGNDASLEDAECTVYFKGGLVREVTAATHAFCMPNPYSSIAYNAGGRNSVAGIPASYVSASGKYFWLLKRTKVWIAPQADGPGKVDTAREVVFRHDGSLGIHDPAEAQEKYQQHAGFIIDNNAGDNGATFIQINL